jgi:hypothetical protein
MSVYGRVYSRPLSGMREIQSRYKFLQLYKCNPNSALDAAKHRTEPCREHAGGEDLSGDE